MATSGMRKIKIEDAVGMVLGHDVTQIIPGKYKGPRFKRGHLIKEEDIQEFLKIGKEHVYVMELKPGIIHEDEAAVRLGKAFSGKNIDYGILGKKPVLGLPACVFYHSATLFDIVFPRILAGRVLTRREISLLGHGGFCQNCDPCHFPVCPFGKG